MVLLHELAHRTGVFGQDNFPDDLEKSNKAQLENDTKLYENCLKPLLPED